MAVLAAHEPQPTRTRKHKTTLREYAPRNNQGPGWIEPPDKASTGTANDPPCTRARVANGRRQQRSRMSAKAHGWLAARRRRPAPSAPRQQRARDSTCSLHGSREVLLSARNHHHLHHRLHYQPCSTQSAPERTAGIGLDEQHAFRILQITRRQHQHQRVVADLSAMLPSCRATHARIVRRPHWHRRQRRVLSASPSAACFPPCISRCSPPSAHHPPPITATPHWDNQAATCPNRQL